MSKADLFEKLQYVKAYRDQRLAVAEYVLENKPLFPELLKFCFEVDNETRIRACWILEFVCHKKLDWLFPHLNYFLKHLPHLKDESAIRPCAKVCEMLCELYFSKKKNDLQDQLTAVQLEQLTEINFDWLIHDKKVATKAYAMHSLFLLGKRFEWIRQELKNVLEKGFSEHSAAYKARARHILNKLP